ncbi:MAG: hypothetical protein KAJ13_02105 [Gemmatimonadetes bacterium]|nr:hypothetical protein [Gemmatimonadota bacterium]
MSQNSGEDRLGTSAGAQPRVDVDAVLRAKYLDYCSARISEVFLSLTDEHTYQLMEEAALEADLTVGALSFQAMMQLVTRKLRKSVPLPDMETWVMEYTEDPGRYDPHLLGLWESEEPDANGQQGEER